MADAAPAAPSSAPPPPEPPPGGAGETFSKEYVAQLKDQLEAKTRSEALLKSKYAAHEQRQRAVLTSLQPTVQEWVKAGLEAGSVEDKAIMQPMMDFADSLHNTESLESAMPLSRMISVHSARYKRSADQASAGSDASAALGKAHKELEEVTADRDAKRARVAELETLVSEQQTSLEKVTADLAAAGGIKERLNFSNSSSREVNPTSAGASSSSSGARPSSSSSAPSARFVDPLEAFVTARGTGGGRLAPSSTSHPFTGMVQGSGDGGVMEALRSA